MGQNMLFRIILILFLIASIVLLRKLMYIERDSGEMKFCLVVMFPFSVYVLFSVCYAANMEIIGVFFFLCSLLQILQEKKGAYVYMILSAAVYPASLLLFLIVNLMFQKKIGRVIVDILTVSIPGAILYVILSRSVFPEMGNIIWADTLSHGFPIIAGNNMSFFAIGFIMVAIATYLTPENKKEFLFYYLMSAALVITVFASYHSYYMVITVPLILLVFGQNISYFRTNLLLYLVYSVCGIVCMLWNDEGYFLKRILANVRNVDYYVGAVAACMAASAILMIGVNCPFYEFKSEIMSQKCEKWLIWITVFVGCPFILLSIF